MVLNTPQIAMSPEDTEFGHCGALTRPRFEPQLESTMLKPIKGHAVFAAGRGSTYGEEASGRQRRRAVFPLAPQR
jgi:hypothetical protein